MSQKLTQHVVDMDKLEEEAKSLVEGHDVAFCAVGVGQPSKTPREVVQKVC